MVLKLEAYFATTVFIVLARFVFCHNTAPTSTALSDIMVNDLQTGIKNLRPTV